MATQERIEVKRFRQVREEAGLTQSEMAAQLGIKNSTADIERGRTKLSGQVVAALLEKFQVSPLWLFGRSHERVLTASGQDTSPRVITLDSQQNENIVMVPIKASAGYASNVQDTDWYSDLPVFSLPLPRFQQGSFRAFEVKGDSMLPQLQPGEWVMGQAVENVSYATDGRMHVVVTQDSVLVKKLKRTSDPRTINLISLNRDYPVIEQPVEEIVELWECASKLSFDMNTNEESSSLMSLQQGLDDLKKEIFSMKMGRA